MLSKRVKKEEVKSVNYLKKKEKTFKMEGKGQREEKRREVRRKGAI